MTHLPTLDLTEKEKEVVTLYYLNCHENRKITNKIMNISADALDRHLTSIRNKMSIHCNMWKSDEVKSLIKQYTAERTYMERTYLLLKTKYKILVATNILLIIVILYGMIKYY